MTDATGPRPLKVFTCYNPRKPTESCYGLVEDADEPRRLHREWHKHEESVKDGYRKTINQNAEIALKAIAARDEEISGLRQEIADLGRDVTGIEIPQPVLGIEINRDGYTEDELDAEPAPESADLSEEDAYDAQAAREDAEAAFGTVAPATPQIDPSPLYQAAIDRPDEPIGYSPYPTIPSV
jgi:hypothetical protein